MSVRFFVVLTLLLSTSAQSKPELMIGEFDIAGYSFRNHCLDEGSLALDGESVQAVFNYNEDNGRIRLVNRAVGQVRGYGALSGDELIISLAIDAIPNVPNGVNLDEEFNGIVVFMYQAHIVNLSRPETGVSFEQSRATLVFRDGIFTIVGSGSPATEARCTKTFLL